MFRETKPKAHVNYARITTPNIRKLGQGSKDIGLAWSRLGSQILKPVSTEATFPVHSQRVAPLGERFEQHTAVFRFLYSHQHLNLKEPKMFRMDLNDNSKGL